MGALEDSKNLFIQSLPNYTSWLFYMLLNDVHVDIEKTDRCSGICSPNFAVDEFLGLFLDASDFSITQSVSAKLINPALSYFCYWLNSKILVSSECITIVKISSFPHNFLSDSSLFLILKELRHLRQ